MSSWQNPEYRHLSLGWDRGWCQAFLDPLVRARIGWERISLLEDLVLVREDCRESQALL